jgi:DNA-binding MarR family transcriptional regulator
MINNYLDEEALAIKVSAAINQLNAELVRTGSAQMLRLLQSEGLSLPRGVALIFVERVGTASISDISQYLNLSLAATSHLIDQLVCAGYVTRVEDLHDRRQKMVSLTAKGDHFVTEYRQMRIDELARRLTTLPAPLLEAALTSLTDILRHLSAVGARQAQTQFHQ